MQNYRIRCKCMTAFGLGLVISCVLPTGCILFIAGIIIIMLGVLMRR